MRNILLAFVFMLISSAFYAQSNQDIANVYLKKATRSMDAFDLEQSLVYFEKAMKLTDTITKAKTAKLGTYIHYELKKYEKAIYYAKQYFTLTRNKKSEEYTQFVELYVTIGEENDAKIAKEKEEEELRLQKEKELRRIDSLKAVWNDKSNALSINVDSIYTFNKKNLALIAKDGYYGIINDLGESILKADTYKDAKSFDGYFLFMDKKSEPTKIYCYDVNKKEGFTLPGVSDFNPISTHYGKVMLPRGNGRLVMYPNNSFNVMVYDLEERKFVRISNQKELLKSLKKSKKIDKFNKEGNVRINKVWYGFGGHIGGGIHPLLIEKTYNLTSFLFSIDGTVLKTATKYAFLGAFYNNKSEAIENGKRIWVNQNGTKVDAPKDESGTYTGDSKRTKLENGSYQIKQNGIIIKGKQKLERMADFLRSSVKK